MVTVDIGLYAGTKIPRILKMSLRKAVDSGHYLNESDFIRDAIREKLTREGYLLPPPPPPPHSP